MTSFKYPAVRIVQFAKAPIPGRVKTRLIPELGASEACSLHQRLARHTLSVLIQSKLAPVELHCDHPEHSSITGWAKEFGLAEVVQQVEGDLGNKMYAAIAQSLAQQAVDAVLLVGSDCPFIDDDYLQRCIELLNCGSELVLGPACDGGYVLIAMRSPHRELFKNVDWGGPEVLQQTLRNASALGLTVELLAELHDIDRPEDLALLEGLSLLGGEKPQ